MSEHNTQDIFNDLLPEKLAGSSLDIDAVYQFDISGDNGGQWVIDFSGDEPEVSQGTVDSADCVVEMEDGDFVDMWNGDLPGPQAFMMGKISIDGDMSLAMKLRKFIG